MALQAYIRGPQHVVTAAALPEAMHVPFPCLPSGGDCRLVPQQQEHPPPEAGLPAAMLNPCQPL